MKLLERIETGEGHDRALNLEICLHFGQIPGDYEMVNGWPQKYLETIDAVQMFSVPDYTNSVDAGLKLLNGLKAGFEVQMNQYRNGKCVVVIHSDLGGTHTEMPRALLAAICRTFGVK